MAAAPHRTTSHPPPQPCWPRHPEWRRVVHEVNRLGLETGHEFAAALSATGERVGPITAGGRHTVVVADEARPLLNAAGADLAICHNHPAHPGDVPNELSPSDFVLLGCAGVRSVHMVSSYEPEGYSIALRLVDLDRPTWMAAIRLARDVAWDLTTSAEACGYHAAHGLEHLDHQRLLVRLLDRLGLIDWDSRFDGATAHLEYEHGGFFDDLAEQGVDEFVRRLTGDHATWAATDRAWPAAWSVPGLSHR